ncbi:MAG TPA: hypothetical protein VFS76_23495 [Pyrinomonadaceae bacterium]|nr:hypothetical protein [Pyrinomonadaceae bacterium]
MSIRSAINRLFAIGSRRQQVPISDLSPQLLDWPLPEALPLAPPKIRATFEPRTKTPPGIKVFAYPFEQPEFAEFVRDSWFSSPDRRFVIDGKYCEFTSRDGFTHYIPCARLINTLEQMEWQAGRGLARLRLVALDSFEYEEAARQLLHEFEKETSPPQAVMGFARVLLGTNPERALEILIGAQQRGMKGAALSACQARTAFACGLGPDGVRLAAEALRNTPDDLWMPADHIYTWGLLHGAALASREDATLRREVLSALESLLQAEHSARRALACATLAALTGDLSASNRAAQGALDCADVDSEVAAEAVWLLRYARNLDNVVTQLSQSPNSIDTRGVVLNSTGWFLDKTISRPECSIWHDSDQDTITLRAAAALVDTKIADVEALRKYCRQVAEDHRAGLVEAGVILSQPGPALQMIYKNLEGRAFTFTGVQIIALPTATLTWSVVAQERGTTGIREALVTDSLLGQGRLTVEGYEESWACDPYEPRYKGRSLNTPVHVGRCELRHRVSHASTFEGPSGAPRTFPRA